MMHQRCTLSWIHLLLSGVLFISSFSMVRAQARVEPVLSGPTVPGSVFSVDVRIGTEAEPVASLFGVSFELAYDSSVLSFVDDEQGTLFGSSPVYALEHDAAAGVLGIGISKKQGEEPVDGMGVAVQLRFRVQANASPRAVSEIRMEDVVGINASNEVVNLDLGSLIFEIEDPPLATIPLIPNAMSPRAVGESFWVDVMLGSEENPAEDVFGLGFELTYNPEQVTLIRYEAGTFLGAGTIFTANDDPVAGILGAGTSRTGGSGGVDGTGVVLRAQFQVQNNLEPGSQLVFSTQDIVATDPEGGSLFFLPGELEVDVISAPEPISVLYPTAASPQPTGGVFWVDILAGSEDLPVEELFGLSFELDYDERFLTMAGHEVGGFLGNNIVYIANDDPDEGRVGVGVSQRAGAGGANGTGVVARIEFAVDVSTPNEQPLTFNVFSIEATRPDGTTFTLNPESLTILANAVPNPVPVLSSISVDEAEQGEAVQVVAQGEAFFEGTTTVQIDGEGVSVEKQNIVSFRELTFDLVVDPAAPPGERQVTVLNGLPGGGSSTPATFTVIDVEDRPVPILTEVQPKSGVIGEAFDLVLTGSNFIEGISEMVVSGTGVNIERFDVVSETQIEATVQIEEGAAPGNRSIEVVTRPPGGGNSEAVFFEVLSAPRPDLVVQDVRAPDSRFFGELVQVSWTVTNQGDGDTGSEQWFDRIYISEDAQLDTRTALSFASIENLTRLSERDTGGSAYTNQTSFRIPIGLEGRYYVFVVTDAFKSITEDDETNNTVASVTQVEITAPPLPDLQVTSVASQSSAFTRDTLIVSWTVENRGDGPADVNQWFDTVFLSDDDQIDFTFTRGSDRISFTDPVLNTQSHSGPLEPGESYTGQTEVVLPARSFGQLHFIVYTDIMGPRDVSDGRVFEFNNNFNNIRSATIDVTLRPPPDLVVTEIEAPATATSGQSITLSWVVENEGAGETIATAWRDEVYLSADNTLDDDDHLVASVPRSGDRLAPDSSYTAETTIFSDHRLDGNFTFFVVTDPDDAVFENDAKGNNTRALTSPIAITPNPPDLQVSEVFVLSEAKSGQPLTVSWAVQNRGSGSTFEDRWTDYVFLTDTPTIEGSTITPLGTVPHGGRLDADAEYTETEEFAIADGVSGTRYLHVITDFNGGVFEHTEDAENNNTFSLSDPVEIELSPWPDLQVTAIEVTTTDVFQAGSPFVVSWRIENRGEGQATGEWEDRIYISHSPDFALQGATESGIVSAPATLAPGESYASSAIISLPSFATAGTYYLHILTDTDDIIYEHTDNDNNENTSEGIEFEAYPPVDVVVKNVMAPEEGATGQPITITWDVANEGEATTLDTQWFDVVYLSEDEVLDPGDRALQSVRRNGVLAAGAEYARSVTIQIPQNAAGIFWLIVQTQVSDSNTANNVQAASSTIGIAQSPAPDLVVNKFVAPTGGFSGQPFEVSWEIANKGSAPTPELWYDALYLSRDDKLGQGDIRLGTFINRGVLQPGEMSTITEEVELPPTTSGAFNLLFRTDSNNAVFESDESNNSATGTGDAGDPVPIEVTTPAPSDLIVTGIDFDPNAVPGEPFTVTWTVENISPNPAVGQLRDAVYISLDDSFQVQDPLLGILDRRIDLDGGESMQISMKANLAILFEADLNGNITRELPGVLPGSYRLIVRTDIRDSIAELEDGNNDRSSRVYLS